MKITNLFFQYNDSKVSPVKYSQYAGLFTAS